MKILIVKTSSLGDIIHTFPVIEYLKEKNPSSQIDWIVEAPFAELVQAHPYVNQVYRVETRNWRKAANLLNFRSFMKNLRKTKYDVLFDFQGNLKSALFNVFAKASIKAGFGRKTVTEWPNLLTTRFKADPETHVNVRQENLFLVQQFFKDSSSYLEKGIRLKISAEQERLIDNILKNSQVFQRTKILVCPGSAWQNKQMTPNDLESFLNKIKNKISCCFLLIWGNEAEKKLVQHLHDAMLGNSIMINKLPIPVLQNLMDRMDLIIAMDSLPLHLAGTTSAQTYGLFGASSANK